MVFLNLINYAVYISQGILLISIISFIIGFFITKDSELLSIWVVGVISSILYIIGAYIISNDTFLWLAPARILAPLGIVGTMIASKINRLNYFAIIFVGLITFIALTFLRVCQMLP